MAYTVNLTQSQIDKWLTDLRSGNYEQGSGELFLPDGRHCCLGVLCRSLPNVSITPIRRDLNPEIRVMAATFQDDVFPSFSSSENVPPELIPQEAQDILTSMNDLKRLSFYQIADWIQTNLTPAEPN